MKPIALRIEGVDVWAPDMPGWDVARMRLCGKVESPPPGPARLAPSLLPAGERRRAPESVLMAVGVAQQACARAAREPAQLAHVFASANGDLAVTDYLCTTLAQAPLEVSPTKFHNSVHNAPAGYWAIAAGCRESSTAISAGDATFSTGLFEAALFADSEACPVLLVAYDIAAPGALRDVAACDVPFAAAFVLAPDDGSGGGMARLRLTPRAQASLAPETGLLHASYPNNPAARCVPLLTALALGRSAQLALPLSAQLALAMEISF